MNLRELIEAVSGKEFYNQLANPNFKHENLFKIKIPLKFLNPGKNIKTDILMKVPVDMSTIDRYVDAYINSTAKLKKKYDSYAFWYNNFNKLIFESMDESDACLFLAACAFASANTALDQNILEAAKLFSAVVDDFDRGPQGIQDLKTIIMTIKDNNSNENIAKLEQLVANGSYYAAMLAPKLDYKGGKVPQGARKGQNDIFSEITVSNAKIPNFNMFVDYYLKHDGKVTKEQVMNDLRSGVIKVGGTKINSFFMNLMDPDYKWRVDEDSEEVSPATIDRWMIRVFFFKPLVEIVDELIDAEIVVSDNDENIRIKDTDSPEQVQTKRDRSITAKRKKLLGTLIMNMFSDDTVRQNIVKILNTEAKKAGLNAQQLQALAWVQVREEFGEPHAKFAKFEDVMDYAKETTAKIFEMNKDLEFIKVVGVPMKNKFNDAIRTIHILAKSPRFKFKDPKDVTDTIANRNNYEKVYYLPPKEAKKAKSSEDWLMTRIALKDEPQVSLRDNNRAADIFILSGSKTEPVHQVRGKDRKSTLKAAARWIFANI